MKKYFVTVFLCGLIQTAQAIDTFDYNTNILTLDSVVADGIKYNKVSVLLVSYVVLGIGSQETFNPDTGSTEPLIKDTCSSDNLTALHFNMIQLGMTLDQINKIVGCKYDPGSTFRSELAIAYLWHTQNQRLYVYFDTHGLYSKDIGGGIFKSALGF